jgi:hypothetical protein
MHVCNVLLVNKYLVKKKSHTKHTQNTAKKHKKTKERKKETNNKRLYIKDPARVDIKNKYM